MWLEFVHLLLRGVAWIISGPLDRRRIWWFFEGRGESVGAIRWTPVATGWMSHWYDRIYSVQFVDAKGVTQTAKCRTSWRTGVVVMTADGEVPEGKKCA